MNRQSDELQIRTELAENLFSEKQVKEGTAELQRLEPLVEKRLSPNDILHFHSKAANCYFEAKMYGPAEQQIKKARLILKTILKQDPSPDIWESMLGNWSNIDSKAVQLNFYKGDEAAIKDALIISEASKGRLLTWFRWGDLKEGPELALSDDRIKTSIKEIQKWASRGKRTVISLFADKYGLAVFVIGSDGKISGRVIQQANYDSFLKDYYEPWEQIVDNAMNERKSIPQANSLTNLLLEKIGCWFEIAFPDITGGGEELVIIPHRLFRSLPLSHCRFFNGKRLSEIYNQVTSFPTIFDFSNYLKKTVAKKTIYSKTALVDPDHTLPLSRLEGFLTASYKKTKVGSEVTAKALVDSLTNPGVILLSCHGDFNDQNPWRSLVRLADGDLELVSLLEPGRRIEANLIILGVCEAAKTRHSLSDEPLGFPGVLIQGGVEAVIAPLWDVDDFICSLFITQFIQKLDNGFSPPKAIKETTEWLRDIQAKEALGILRSFKIKLKKLPKKENNNKFIQARLNDYENWLQAIDENSKPFESPLDWAAFKLSGICSLNKEENNQ